MTNPTPHGQVPASSAVLKAIREANMQLVHTGDDAYMLLPYLQAHVQNPAEIEHVAGDVSKNGAEVNTNVYAELPPRYYLAGGVEKTWDQQQMCVFADATHALRAQQPTPAATPQADSVTAPGGPTDAQIDACARSMLSQPWGIGSRIEDARAFAKRILSKFAPPAQAADSQPAPEYVGNGMFKGETIEKAAEHWANWCDVRCMTGLSEFLRVVAARAPADSVTAPAAGTVAGPSDDEVLNRTGYTPGKHEDDLERDLIRWYRKLPATPPIHAADNLLEDAARYRYLRDGDWREHEKLEAVIRLQLNVLWDATIDAARKQGGA